MNLGVRLASLWGELDQRTHGWFHSLCAEHVVSLKPRLSLVPRFLLMPKSGERTCKIWSHAPVTYYAWFYACRLSDAHWSTRVPLIMRESLVPVFDHLQYVKWRGGSPGRSYFTVLYSRGEMVWWIEWISWALQSCHLATFSPKPAQKEIKKVYCRKGMLHNNHWSHNLIGPYHFWVISPRNSTLFTRLFRPRRHAWAGHETMLYCAYGNHTDK